VLTFKQASEPIKFSLNQHARFDAGDNDAAVLGQPPLAPHALSKPYTLHLTAFEGRGNDSTGFKDFYLKAMARI